MSDPLDLILAAIPEAFFSRVEERMTAGVVVALAAEVIPFE